MPPHRKILTERIPSKTEKAALAGTAEGGAPSDSNRYITAGEKGAANGIPPLDPNQRIPVQFMPTSAITNKGNWDASTNTPALADGVGLDGDTYYVNVAGSTNLDGETDWKVGDKAQFVESIGKWTKQDNTESVVSVAGKTGNVSLDTSDVSEDPSALYFTAARVLATELAGLAAQSGNITASDTILQAFGKIKDYMEGGLTLTPDEKDALAGTSGTPSDTNRYVTDEDPRNADARQPVVLPGAPVGTHPNIASITINNQGLVSGLIAGTGTVPLGIKYFSSDHTLDATDARHFLIFEASAALIIPSGLTEMLFWVGMSAGPTDEVGIDVTAVTAKAKGNTITVNNDWMVQVVCDGADTFHFFGNLTPGFLDLAEVVVESVVERPDNFIDLAEVVIESIFTNHLILFSETQAEVILEEIAAILMTETQAEVILEEVPSLEMTEVQTEIILEEV